MLSFDLVNVISTVINLLILMVGFRLVLFKPVQKIIAQRQEEAENEFKIAEEKQIKADELKKQYEESISGIEEQKKQTLKEAQSKADEQYHKIVKDAKDEAEEIKKKATFDAEAQKAQIIRSAEKEIADLVVNATSKVAGGVEVDASLYDEFLNKAGE